MAAPPPSAASAIPLHGSCHCQRNRYTLMLPAAIPPPPHFYIFADDRPPNAPNPPLYLRVPLTHYASTTHAYFPDETHASIRRTYHTPDAISEDQAVAGDSSSTRRKDTVTEQRHFCGHCGATLSLWDERTRADADFINLALATLQHDALRVLEARGLLPARDAAPLQPDAEVYYASTLAPHSQPDQEPHEHTDVVGGRDGAPWFESFEEDTVDGRIRRRKGGHASHGGAVQVEWEVVELDAADRVVEHSQQRVVEKRKFADDK